MPANVVLYYLDNLTDDDAFERLCSDLLLRVGWSSLIPLGGKRDAGRDAEVLGGTIYFQYSLQKDWERKLRDERLKLGNRLNDLKMYWLLTAAKVSGEKRDQWKQMFSSEHAVELIILDREWLRLHLEGPCPDLAERYLGIPPNLLSAPKGTSNKQVLAPEDAASSPAWKAYLVGSYAHAYAFFLSSPETNEAEAAAIVHCCYELGHYREALSRFARQRWARISSDWQTSIHGAILVEGGLSLHSHQWLEEGLAIFAERVKSQPTWHDHFNYGNALAAVGRHDDACTAYRTALTLSPRQETVWKNLGSSLHNIGEFDEEFRCYDEALRLNPHLPEAWASRGISLVRLGRDLKTALGCLDKAEALDKEFYLRSSSLDYHRAQAHSQLGEHGAAVDVIDKALRTHPDCARLNHGLKTALSVAWRESQVYLPRAKEYFERECMHDRLSLAECIAIAVSEGDHNFGVQALSSYFQRPESDFVGNSLSEWELGVRHLDIYGKFRESQPTSRLAGIVEHRFPGTDHDWEAHWLRSIPVFAVADHNLAETIQIDLHSTLAELLSPCLRSLTTSIVSRMYVPPDVSTSEELFEVMSDVHNIVAEVGIREVTSTIGFCSGRHDREVPICEGQPQGLLDQFVEPIVKGIYDALGWPIVET